MTTRQKRVGHPGGGAQGKATGTSITAKSVAPAKPPAKPKPVGRIEEDSEKEQALNEMNARYAVVTEQGRTHVLEFGYSQALERRVINRCAFDSITKLYQHREVMTRDKNGDRPIGLGQWWLDHPKRRIYSSGVVFDPTGRQYDADTLNLWEGLAVKPKRGDWSLFHEHIRENVCGGSQDLYDWLICWIAQIVQQPGELPGSAVAVQGDKGSGKTIFAEWLGRAFNPHTVVVSNPDQIFGKHNDLLEDAVMVILDEASWLNNKRLEGAMKRLITDRLNMIEPKFLKPFPARNFCHLIITGNDDWMVPASKDERRFFALRMGNGRRQDHRFFGELDKQMRNGGLEAMLYDLQRVVTSRVNLRQPPSTDALVEQKLQSLDTRDRWLYDKLATGRLLRGHSAWIADVAKDQLFDDYNEHTRGDRSKRSVESELGRYLKTVFGYRLRVHRPASGGRAQRWLFPALAECRSVFDAYLGGAVPWPAYDDDGDGVVVPINRPRPCALRHSTTG